VRIDHRLDDPEELGPQRVVRRGGVRLLGLLGLLRLGRRRPDELGGVEPRRVELRHPLDAELRLALEGADRPLRLHEVLLLEEGGELVHALERAGLELTGLVLERDGQVGLAALGGRDRLASDEEGALHPLALLDVLHPDLVHGGAS